MWQVICVIKKIVPFIVFSVLFCINIFAEQPSVSAYSAISADAETFGILYEKNADEKLPMASTTKIITALTAIMNADISDTVTVSENAARTEGSSVYLKSGDRISLEKLLYALMLESGNDAAVAVAEHVSGTEADFVALMNETCYGIGAYNTHCVTASGLDAPEHYTTARDLALITRYALKNDTFRTIVSTPSKEFYDEDKETSVIYQNHNKLLKSCDGVYGVKTGYTKKSGRCLVSAAERNGAQTIVVTLNAPDDWNDHEKLLDYSFESYAEYEAVTDKNAVMGYTEVAGCKDKKIPFYASDDCFLRKTSSKFDVRINLSPLCAPLEKGSEVGSADIYKDGYYIKSVNLISGDYAPSDDYIYILKKSYINLLEILLNTVRDGQ